MNTGGRAATACVVAPAATMSSAVPTVATVTFTTTLVDLESAEIEFGPAAGGARMVAPVDLARQGYATVLLGMKPSASYVYRVKVSSSTGSCVSDDQTVVTGAFERSPEPTVTILDATQHQRGFIVAVGLARAPSGDSPTAFILDGDGTVVWVAPEGSVPPAPSRAHLSWDGTRLIVMGGNPLNGDDGAITSMAMDGSDVRSLPGVVKAHHDFAAIPGGIATIFWNQDGGDGPCSLVELPDAGEPKVIVADLATVYSQYDVESKEYHTNSIHFYEADHSYTVGDRRASTYVKIAADGELVWQLGGYNPKDPSRVFTGAEPWVISHGHHLTADGTFVFFNNSSEADVNKRSYLMVYQLDLTNLTASKLHERTVQGSSVWGDAQRLPNGNFLVTSSVTRAIVELSPVGVEVMSISAGSSGYTEFRPSLYGPPSY
jgi:hypothetical protein